MDVHQESQDSSSPHKNNRKLLALVIPLLSCGVTSVVGIIIGQIGNLIYRGLGDMANCMTVPGFIGLFVVTFGLSFLSNKLFRKWLSGLVK